MSATKPNFVTISEAARICGVTRENIYNWVVRKKLAPRRRNRRIFEWDKQGMWEIELEETKKVVTDVQAGKLLPKPNAFVVHKKTGMGPWHRTDAKVFSQKRTLPVMAPIVDLERSLNNGMLAEEAEAAYPRMGYHNHPIYRVSHQPPRIQKSKDIIR